MDVILCSACFKDQGLRLDAERIGKEMSGQCPICNQSSGKKLDKDLTEALAHSFFVRGTIQKYDYGGSPIVQFNQHQETNLNVSVELKLDLCRIGQAINVGFFYYGPRLWMIGHVEPLEALQDPIQREAVVQRILTAYPEKLLTRGELFYRIRKSPTNPNDPLEYDSPPASGTGRLDTTEQPALYASQDLSICLHECRITAEDNLFVATLVSTRDLRLLDLTILLKEEDLTEFESLDMAIHMLFLAGPHAYEITRSLALSAQAAGFDGIIYPSYFSLLKTGSMPFETAYGISLRRFPDFQEYEQAKTIPNFALFGRPIRMGLAEVCGINRLILRQVEYSFSFGPAEV